jgi:enterochelin esterase family protein
LGGIFLFIFRVGDGEDVDALDVGDFVNLHEAIAGLDGLVQGAGGGAFWRIVRDGVECCGSVHGRGHPFGGFWVARPHQIIGSGNMMHRIGIGAVVWMALMDGGMAFGEEVTIGPTYTNAPEMMVKEGVPRGVVHEFVMKSEESKMYPGLKGAYARKCTVYVPAGYVERKAAPVIVVQDGMGYVKTLVPVLDNLIHEKRVPAMVAVFLNSGGGDGRGSERGLEYDTVSGKYAEWVESEVFPRIEKEFKVVVSKDPDERATMGGSSGGAAAFTMAWFHPELYHRVLTYSGTYVDQQSPKNAESPHGAWEYHEHLIPRSEKKPIRIWLEVSENDNGAKRDEASLHNWVLANQRMAAALKAKGYAYKYVYALGAGHTDGKVTRQTIGEAMEWVWKRE